MRIGCQSQKRHVVLSRMHCNVEFYYVWKIQRTDIGRPSKQRRVVLRRRNTVVGGKCALPSALLVCLSVCLCARLLKKRIHWFGWNVAYRQMSGHGRTDSLLSPIRIIVRMPEPENRKIDDLSKSVKQAPHSKQATGHVMHCREILFIPRCGATRRQSCPISDFGLFSPYKTSLHPMSYIAEWLQFCRVMLCISAAIAVMRCLSVRLSVTFVNHVKTNKHMFKFFSPF